MSFQPDTVIKQNEDQLTSRLEGELILLNLDRGKYYGLGATGLRIWDLIAGEGRSIKDICRQLQAEYDVSPEECQADVAAFAEMLAAADMIKLQPPGQ